MRLIPKNEYIKFTLQQPSSLDSTWRWPQPRRMQAIIDGYAAKVAQRDERFL
jgi:hypothetical protein